MKIHCERDKLLPAFQMAASVVPSRSPKPILQSVKLATRNDRTVLLATDLEIGVCIGLTGVTVEAPGEVMLPTSRFGAILKESPTATFCIEDNGTWTGVSGERTKFSLAASDPREFPEIAGFTETDCVRVPVRFLRELIRRTIFATDPDSGRYALGGVLFQMRDDKFIGVATDGRRLALQEGTLERVGDPQLPTSDTVVPVRALQILERSLVEPDEMVELAVRQNHLLVRSGRFTMYTRLLEGRFPQWEKIFPDESNLTQIELAVGGFHAAVRQAAIVTDDTHPGVRFEFGDGKAVLTACSSETGESHVEYPIAYDGPKISVQLDPKFLIDFLRVLAQDSQMTICIRDGETPLTLRTDDGYVSVVMPLS